MTDTVTAARVVSRADGKRLIVAGVGSALIVKAPVRQGRVVVPGGSTGMRQVGWLTTSSKPIARRGTSTYFFHRDNGSGGRGQHHALFRLPNLEPGRPPTLQTGQKTQTFAITQVKHFNRRDLPASLLDRTGPRRVALVTCGGGLRLDGDGVWRWAKQSVVYATPAG